MIPAFIKKAFRRNSKREDTQQMSPQMDSVVHSFFTVCGLAQDDLAEVRERVTKYFYLQTVVLTSASNQEQRVALEEAGLVIVKLIINVHRRLRVIDDKAGSLMKNPQVAEDVRAKIEMEVRSIATALVDCVTDIARGEINFRLSTGDNDLATALEGKLVVDLYENISQNLSQYLTIRRDDGGDETDGQIRDILYVCAMVQETWAHLTVEPEVASNQKAQVAFGALVLLAISAVLTKIFFIKPKTS